MKVVNLKKLAKNGVSLLLTLIVVSAVLDFVRKPNVPENAATMALQDLQGNPFFLAQLAQDKPTIVYFWGSWCGYCRYTSPTIDRLAQEGYPVVTVAMNSGSSQQVQQYLTEHQLQFTTVNDPHSEFAKLWQVNVTPTIIILHNGKMDLATTGWTSYWGLKVRLFLSKFF